MSCALTLRRLPAPSRLAGASPSIVKQIIPLLDQLTPIYLDIANGTQEFTPAPEESRSIIRQGALRPAWPPQCTPCRAGFRGPMLCCSPAAAAPRHASSPNIVRPSPEGYTVPRNLLLRFSADEIDETPQLASTLQSSAVASMLELTVKTLPGEHARPLQQVGGRWEQRHVQAGKGPQFSTAAGPTPLITHVPQHNRLLSPSTPAGPGTHLPRPCAAHQPGGDPGREPDRAAGQPCVAGTDRAAVGGHPARRAVLLHLPAQHSLCPALPALAALPAPQAGLPEQATNQLSGLAKLGLGMTSMLAQTVASATAPGGCRRWWNRLPAAGCSGWGGSPCGGGTRFCRVALAHA